MYDELVKRLRHSANLAERGLTPPPSELREAADTIEKMSEAYDKLSRHMDDLAALMPRWIPVNERLPEKNQIVVVVQPGKTWDYGQFRGLAYLGGNIHKWNWKNNTTKTVDYWMPKKSALPEPPKEE